MSADTATSVDWALLEAEMPSIPCEHGGHGWSKVHGGDATHYCETKCPECGHFGPLRPLCGPFVAVLLKCGIKCTVCSHRGDAETFIQILQPIRSTP